MPVLERHREVTAHAELVWSILADPGAESAAAPGGERVDYVSGNGASLVRRVVGAGNHAWQEHCTDWSPEQRFTMRVETGGLPLPVSRLRYTCSMAVEGMSVRLRLYFDYQPAYGLLGSLVDRFGLRRELAGWADRVLDHWVRRIHAREWAYRVTVATLLDEKGRHIHAVTPETSVADAAEILRRERIGSVLVLDDSGAIAGVLSERDIVRGLPEKGAELMAQSVSTIMTRDVIVANPGDNMMLVMACMSDNRIRHLPVVESSEVVGIISIGDVVRARISELEGQSETLRDYIEARHWNELYREIGPAAYAQEA